MLFFGDEGGGEATRNLLLFLGFEILASSVISRRKSSQENIPVQDLFDYPLE